MKKSLLIAAIVVAAALSRVWAGHFIDVLPPASAAGCQPVSNGYDYNCTTDTGAPTPVYAAPIQLFSRTLAQINALVPTAVGQVAFCSNCVQSFLCVSTATVAGSYVVVGGTTTTGGAAMACR